MANEWEDEEPKPPMTPDRLAFLMAVGIIIFVLLASYW